MTVKELLGMAAEKFNELVYEKIKNRADHWKAEKEKDSKKKNKKKRKSEMIKEKLINGKRLTIDEFSFFTGIKITEHCNGKMIGMYSLNSSCLLNNDCLARMKKGIGVCCHCFSVTWQLMSGELFENIAFNTLILRDKILPKEIIPIIPYTVFRLESFGDVNNYIQVVNYFLFCTMNPDVHFTVWTKNPKYYYEAIQKGYEKPNNLTIIYSSFALNRHGAVKEEYKTFVDKVFTVYTIDWLIKNKKSIDFINCGGRHCMECQKCYLKAKESPYYINEILKSDQTKAENHYGTKINCDSVCNSGLTDVQYYQMLNDFNANENFENLLK